MPDFDRLEARVEQDRAALANSFDELTDTFSAERIATNLSDTVKGYGGELGSQAMSAAKQNPAAFALVGAGLALMLSGAGKDRRPAARVQATARPPVDSMDGFDERVATADAKMRAEMTGTSMSPTALKLRANIDRGLAKLPPAARSRVLKARHAALSAQEAVERNAKKTARKAQRLHDDQPMIAGAVAFGFGVLAAALLPNTRREDDLMGARRDALMAEAQRVMSKEMAVLQGKATAAIDKIADRQAAQ